MFRKIVSNLPFSPALVGQLGFYAKRLRKEEATRRIGLIFTALALVVQAFAVFTPPESANAANGNNVIYAGFKSKSELLSIYDRNRDSAGHKDIQQIYSYFGITRSDIANGKWANFNSRDFNKTIKSVGRSTYSFQRTPHKVPDTSTTVYESLVYKFDSTSWSLKNGTDYKAVIGKRAIDGKWFAIMSGCGNPAYISLPPPPPKPAAVCKSLVIAPISRTKYKFTSTASVSKGATISGYSYTIKDDKGTVVHTQTQSSTAKNNSIEYNFTKDGNYTVSVIVKTSTGEKTGSDCQKTLTISPDFELTKTVKNVSQIIDDANNTTAKPGDRLEYRLSVKNVGSRVVSYTLKDNLADVLEYADLIDAGGGTLLKQDSSTPVEKINTISWPPVTIKPAETVVKIVSVQIKPNIPSTPQSLGNHESYNCRLVNDFAGNNTTIKLDCPPPKVVEQVVSELPETGTTENIIFAGVVLTVVVYFYARTRQVKKEVRLVRRDLNAGTI